MRKADGVEFNALTYAQGVHVQHEFIVRNVHFSDFMPQNGFGLRDFGLVFYVFGQVVKQVLRRERHLSQNKQKQQS
jgi:hypothetical protein